MEAFLPEHGDNNMDDLVRRLVSACGWVIGSSAVKRTSVESLLAQNLVSVPLYNIVHACKT